MSRTWKRKEIVERVFGIGALIVILIPLGYVCVRCLWYLLVTEWEPGVLIPADLGTDRYTTLQLFVFIFLDVVRFAIAGYVLYWIGVRLFRGISSGVRALWRCFWERMEEKELDKKWKEEHPCGPCRPRTLIINKGSIKSHEEYFQRRLSEPTSEKEIRQWFDEGRIDEYAQVRVRGQGLRANWRPLYVMPEFPNLFSQASCNRGIAKVKKGDWDSAIADFTRAIVLHSKNAYAYAYLGYAKESKGDWDGAIADCSKAIELDPSIAQAYAIRGSATAKRGDLGGAITDYDKAIELEPKIAFAYNNRGLAKAKKGDWDGAIADCSKAIELDPNYIDAYSNRAAAKKAKGDQAAADEDFAQAAKLAAH